MTVKWKIKEYLDKHRATTYQLWKTSGVSKTTLYAICQGKMDGLHFETMARIIEGLEELTGKKVTPNDILEVVR